MYIHNTKVPDSETLIHHILQILALVNVTMFSTSHHSFCELYCHYHCSSRKLIITNHEGVQYSNMLWKFLLSVDYNSVVQVE